MSFNRDEIITRTVLKRKANQKERAKKLEVFQAEQRQNAKFGELKKELKSAKRI